jgi:Domain of unknown function (DUF4440)
LSIEFQVHEGYEPASFPGGMIVKRTKWFSIVATLALSACTFTYAYRAKASSSTGRDGDERTIRQLNEECLNAYDVGDIGTLDRIEDPDFTVSGDFGVVTKQEHLARVRNRKEKAEVISRKIAPQQFRFYDNVALVTETDRPTGTGGTFAFQSTELWVRRGADWRLVHLHYSPLREKQ